MSLASFSSLLNIKVPTVSHTVQTYCTGLWYDCVEKNPSIAYNNDDLLAYIHFLNKRLA